MIGHIDFSDGHSVNRCWFDGASTCY